MDIWNEKKEQRIIRLHCEHACSAHKKDEETMCVDLAPQLIEREHLQLLCEFGSNFAALDINMSSIRVPIQATTSALREEMKQ